MGGSYPNPTVTNLSNVTNTSLANSGLAHSAITIAGTSVSLGGSTSSFPSPGAIGGTTPAAANFTTLGASGHVTFSGALTSGTITGSWCTDSGGDVINIAGTNCYTGLTNPMTTLGDTIYGGASGTPTRLAGPTAPNGVPQILTDIPSAGAAVAETWQLGGVPVNNNSETTCASQTLNVLDRGTAIFCSGTSTSTFTFPVHTTTGFGSNYPFLIVNNNSGTMTLTPTTDTIDNSSLFTQWADFLYNNSSGNWQTVQVPQFGAFPDCHTSGSSALLFTKSTGAFTCNTISGSGTVNAGAQYQLAMYPNSGTNAVVGPTSTSPKTDASGDLIVGAGCTVASGGYSCAGGSSSGAITFLLQAAAGTYNWEYPTTAGTSGYFLTSAAGSGPMTWTAPATFASLAPTPTRAGDIIYWNGSIWTTLAGNNSGTNCAQENSSGVPSWAACGGGGSTALSAITAATGANTIASGNNYDQIWNWALTTNSHSAFTFGETTAATSGTLGAIRTRHT